MKRAVLVTHHTLGKSLIETVSQILGPSNFLHAVSNSGLSPEGIESKIEQFYNQYKEDTFFLMTEMRGGSTYLACRRFVKKHHGVFLITGCSLPMLTTFITKGDNLNPDELLQTMKTDAIRAIEITESE